MNYPMISIVVPIFNASRYIDRCVGSIVDQAAQNIELILVDDGSVDCSLSLCMKWASRNPCIKVIHQPNGGVSSARNAGLNMAKGDYLLFVDADDWLNPGSISLLQRITKRDCDVIVFDYKEVEENGSVRTEMHSKFPKGRVLDGGESLVQLFEGRFSWNIWQLLIRRRLFDDRKIRFPEDISMGEDLFVVGRLLFFAKKIYFLSDIVYSYFGHSNSAMDMRFADDGHLLRTVRDIVCVQDGLHDLYVGNRKVYVKWVKQVFWQYFILITEICLVKSGNPELQRLRKKMKDFIVENYRFFDMKRVTVCLRYLLVLSDLIQIRIVASTCSLYMNR